MDYIVKKQKKIAYCILDLIDEQFSTSSQEVARNLSDFFLTCVIEKQYDIFIEKDSDSLLKRVASDEFYSHAVVVITGTHTKLSERLFDSVENKCKEYFTLAGHILDRSGFDAYYEIHNQFFIVNMNEYRRLGSPNMGNMSWNDEHIKIEPIRSKENLYDNDELPVWIKQGTNEKVYKNKMHGWNFIEHGLRNGAVFCDVGKDIRQDKLYFYFENDHVFYRHLPELFNYSLICNNMVNPWNSDTIPENISTSSAIDHYVTTGTGLNWVHNLIRLGYHKNTKVTFIDISQTVLSFMKNMVEEWDGIDYHTFYMKQLKFLPDSLNCDNYDYNKHEQNIEEWWSKFEKTFDNFQMVWNDIKKLKYDFKLLDLFVDNKYTFINSKEVTFVNVSDAFNYVPYIHYANVKFRVSRENNLIKTLKKIDPGIILHIPTRIGRFYKAELTEGEKITSGPVKDFAMWDINEFKAPPWQEKNWKSVCPLSGKNIILQ